MEILKSDVTPPIDLTSEKDEGPYSKKHLEALGIITEESRCQRNRRLNLYSIIIPLIGTCAAIFSLPWLGYTKATFSIFLCFFVLNGIGVELALHRYFVHRAFKTNYLIHAALGVLGSWSFQGPIARWVADHRRHHRFSDQPYDAHSPYWIGDKPVCGIKGLCWAHFFWMLKGYVSDEKRYAPDIISDPVALFMSRHYWWFAASGLMLPAFAGYMFGDFQEALRCLLWAGFFRVALLHQLTWSINSIGHYFGEMLPGAKDKSRNNTPLALLTLGVGLHSYHHKHPSAGINEPVLLDIGGWIVMVFEKLGLIWGVRRYP